LTKVNLFRLVGLYGYIRVETL